MKVTITWTTPDITDITNLSDDEAEAWLDANRKHIVDRSIEHGWGVIFDLLQLDGIDRKDNT